MSYARGVRAVFVFELSALALVAVTTARTAAAHTAVNVVYERGPGAEACAGPDALRAAVAARLGYEPFAARPELDTMVVRIRRAGPVLEGTLEQRDPAGRLRGKPSSVTSKVGDCAEVVSALAVGMAIAIDPLSMTREPAQAPPAAPAPPAPPPAVPAPSPPPPPPLQESLPAPAPAAEPIRIFVGAGGSVAAGALPGPGLGVRALLGVSRGLFELDVEGRMDAPVSARAQAGEVDVSLALATLAPCVRYWHAIACAQISVGGLRGTGLGFDHTREDNTLYVGAGARGGLELLAFERVALRAFVEGQVPLRPTRLETNGTPVWSTPPFAGSAVAMVLLRLP